MPAIRLCAAAAFTMLALSACDGTLTVGEPDIPTVNDVTFTRANQSRITFATGARLFVWCGAWEPGAINTPSVHVAYGGPTSNDPFWQLSAVVADVQQDVPLLFPNMFVFDQPRNADLFVVDGTNELSTQIAGSGGSITFQELDCRSGGAVRFSITAVIGSEFGGGPSVIANGSFQGPVGASPP